MKNQTNSRAVNRELTAMATRQNTKKSISTENKVLLFLGGFVVLSILINVIVYGIPNI